MDFIPSLEDVGETLILSDVCSGFLWCIDKMRVESLAGGIADPTIGKSCESADTGWSAVFRYEPRLHEQAIHLRQGNRSLKVV